LGDKVHVLAAHNSDLSIAADRRGIGAEDDEISVVCDLDRAWARGLTQSFYSGIELRAGKANPYSVRLK